MAQVNLSDESERLLKHCKALFIDLYPKMKEVRLSKNKIIYEALKFYLKKTKYEPFIENQD